MSCVRRKDCKIVGFVCLGAIQVLLNLFFWKLDPHPPPRNANNIEPYTFVTLSPGKTDTPHLHKLIINYIHETVIVKSHTRNVRSMCLRHNWPSQVQVFKCQIDSYPAENKIMSLKNNDLTDLHVNCFGSRRNQFLRNKSILNVELPTNGCKKM